MRTGLAKKTYAEFRRQLHEHLPGFEEDASALVPQGWRAFVCRLSPSLTFHLVLAFSRRDDSFTVEAAWTRRGRYPADVPFLCPRAYPEVGLEVSEPLNGDFRFRISALWQPRGYWWHLVPPPSDAQLQAEREAFARTGELPEQAPIELAQLSIGPCTTDAIRRIAEHVVPYFNEVAASEGCPTRLIASASNATRCCT